MKLSIISYLLLIPIFPSGSTITPVVSSLEMETDYVWQCIEQTRFYDDHGYDVAMPKGELIHGLQVDEVGDTP